jgi:hypothetical protein
LRLHWIEEENRHLEFFGGRFSKEFVMLQKRQFFYFSPHIHIYI